MNASPVPNRLAEILASLSWSKEELARVSRVHPGTVQRAINGGQTSARVRARLVGAINERRKALSRPGQF